MQSRAEIWARFAAGAAAGLLNRSGYTPEDAALRADSLLAEFDKRWQRNQYSSVWEPRNGSVTRVG